MSLGVVVVTYERPWHLERCLAALTTTDPEVSEIVVVDGSPTRDAESCARAFGATYLTNPHGYGHMTESRNIGWRACSSDIVAFVDDDAFVGRGWSEAMLESFAGPEVGGVGGRAVQNPDQEPSTSPVQIGQVDRDGTLVANFDNAAVSPLTVHHVIGCNMAFRRTILDEFDGFRADYPGTSLREETDLCLRVLAAGWALRFDPRALVVHVGAPHARGARFDLRYQYYAHRNHAQLLVRNVGFGPMLRAHLMKSGADVLRRFARDAAGAIVRPLVSTGGTAAGVVAGIAAHHRDRRRGTTNKMSGRELERLLSTPNVDSRCSHDVRTTPPRHGSHDA